MKIQSFTQLNQCTDYLTQSGCTDKEVFKTLNEKSVCQFAGVTLFYDPFGLLEDKSQLQGIQQCKTDSNPN